LDVIGVALPAARFLFKSARAETTGLNGSGSVVESTVGVVTQTFEQLLSVNVVVICQLVKLPVELEPIRRLEWT